MGHAFIEGILANHTLIDAIDAFVSAPKVILGVEQACVWGAGRTPYERKAKFPIEYDGEINETARIEVIGFPNSNSLQFRLILCFSAAVCRLDYTDETHANTYRIDAEEIPPEVKGPHFHSWELNRRFFRGLSKAPELRNATAFDSNQFTSQDKFGSILRWFCDEVNIGQPPPGHLIELPQRDLLL